MNELSSWKAVHHPDRINAFRSKRMVYPIQLQIDPVAGCNHDCPFCIYRYHKDDDLNALFDESDIISYDKMIEIFDDCVAMGVKAVEMTGGGEPSAHPQFVELLTALHDRGLEIGLVTNGAGNSWKTKRVATIEAMSQSTWARFSLDASSPATHMITHRSRHGDFEVAIDNIHNLCKTIKKSNSDTVVGITFVIIPENAFEIVSIAILANTLGVDYLRYTPMVFGENSVPEIEARAKPFYDDRLRTQIADDIEKAISLDLDVRLVDAFTDRNSIRHSFGEYQSGDECHFSHLQAVIGADERLYPCCVWKYRPIGNIGSIKELGFKELWDSQQRRDYYDRLDISETCKTCFLKPKNDTLKYLLDPNPSHVNFI